MKSVSSRAVPAPQRTRLLGIILLAYVALGTLFAVYTPAWEAPDEPAHYNYVRYLVDNGDFPVLHMGDYPHAYLEQIKNARFPPDLSIDPIRYEFHQPPLYYALAAPLYLVTGGSLLALRLLSVLLGAGVVLMGYAVARRIYPRRQWVALGTAAFVAFLPQHLATLSQVDNDVLAELLFSIALYQLVSLVTAGDLPATRAYGPFLRSRAGVLSSVGVVIGLILITKTTAYIAVPLAGGVLAWSWWREKAHANRMAADLALVALPAALLALPWFGRNVWTYGWPDFFGLIRHDAIVSGQPRTAEWLGQYGWGGYVHRAVEYTFKSFWGVFGWLGVFMDSRVYLALALLSGLAAGGLALRGLGRGVRRTLPEPDAPSNGLLAPQRTTRAIRLLAISALLTLLVYAWYNVQFVQHQGRYLFTALIPIGVAVTLGSEAALRPRNARWLAGAYVLLGLVFAGWALVTGVNLPKWPLAIVVALAAALGIRSLLPRRLDGLMLALPYAAMVPLALFALFGNIIPQLAR